MKPGLLGRSLASSLALVAAGLAGCAQPGGNDAGLARRVDALVGALVQRHEFTGAVVLTRHGRIVYERGFGQANQASGLAFTPETPSDGASLAKTLTAAGLQLLVHEGRIDLDARVTAYLPSYPHASTTVRQLVTHSNGLPPYYEFFDPFFRADEVRTTEALLARVAQHAPAPTFTPGTRFEYSNLGFDVAALLIERVSGQDYEAFLRQRFLGRLGLTATFARPARLADWPGTRTLGYRWREGAWELFDVFDMEAFLGASNLYFSARDLGRWADAHATGQALPPAVTRAGQQRPLLGGHPSSINALSWFCDETDQRCWYTGDLNAFYSHVYWDRRRGESVAYVSNCTMPFWRRHELAQDLMDALAGQPQRQRDGAPLQGFDEASRPAIAGTYAVAGLGTLRLVADGTGLRLAIGEEPEYQVFPVGREVYYVPGRDFVLAFGGGARPSTVHVRTVLQDHVGQRQPEPAAQDAR